MRLDKFIFFIFSTVFLGALVGILAAASGLWIHVYWFTGLIEGGFLGTTSLMGFWAYLMLNFIARMTIPRRLWVWIQSLLIVWVMYDMFWTRYHDAVALNPHHHATYMTYFVQGCWPFVAALLAALWKRRLSGPGSYLPTVFYLYVFTVVDWLLVIWSNAGPVANETGIVMMACNIYLVLMLGKLLSKPVAASAASSGETRQAVDANKRSETPSLQS
jgi:KinB signaling pathway activation protein